MPAVDVVIVTTTARSLGQECPHMLDSGEGARCAAGINGGRHCVARQRRPPGESKLRQRGVGTGRSGRRVCYIHCMVRCRTRKNGPECSFGSSRCNATTEQVNGGNVGPEVDRIAWVSDSAFSAGSNITETTAVLQRRNLLTWCRSGRPGQSARVEEGLPGKYTLWGRPQKCRIPAVLR